MNKTELVKEITNRTGFSQKDSAKFLDAFQDAIAGAIVSGESVAITGFGNFYLKEIKPRKMISFGKEIETAGSLSVGFKAGKTLKDAIN